MDIFKEKQSPTTPTDLFITVKRSLFAELETSVSQTTQIDMVCGLMRIELRERMEKADIKMFDDLLKKARHVEDDLLENKKDFVSNNKGKQRYQFCRALGHSATECRKKKAQAQSPPSTNKATNEMKLVQRQV